MRRTAFVYPLFLYAKNNMACRKNNIGLYLNKVRYCLNKVRYYFY